MLISSMLIAASWSVCVTNSLSRPRTFMIFQSKIKRCSCELHLLSTSVISKLVLMNVIKLKCWLSTLKTVIVGQQDLNKHASTLSLHGRTALASCYAKLQQFIAELMNSCWASSLKNFWKISLAAMNRLPNLRNKRIISKATLEYQLTKSSLQRPRSRSRNSLGSLNR